MTWLNAHYLNKNISLVLLVVKLHHEYALKLTQGQLTVDDGYVLAGAKTPHPRERAEVSFEEDSGALFIHKYRLPAEGTLRFAAEIVDSRSAGRDG